jgi:hypothetical protein
MIEFSLQVEPRIITAILPELGKLFARSSQLADFSECVPNVDDPDFQEAWVDGLEEDAKNDRNALARLLSDLSSSKPEVRIGYFGYLLTAEIQERIIQEVC